jgi:cellulose synthase/poly-beta-1,6-N-acetylglucosamine synthase-like glycosyltransferase
MNKAGIVSILTTLIILFILAYRIYDLSDTPWMIPISLLMAPFLLAFLIFPVSFILNNILNLFYKSSYYVENSKYYSCNFLDKEKYKQENQQRCSIEMENSKVRDNGWTSVSLVKNIRRKSYELMKRSLSQDHYSRRVSLEERIRIAEIEEGRLSNIQDQIRTDLLSVNHLPGITIQIPVYNEDFDTVIKSTILSAINIREIYKGDGGDVNIIISDDGIFSELNDDMQEYHRIMDEKDFSSEIYKRIKFYNDNNIGYVARKKKNRVGLFKKASNMNFTLSLCKRCSENNVPPHVYTRTLTDPILAKGDLSVRALIVILDSDSRINISSMYASILEFTYNKDIGYIQHSSKPLPECNVNFFTDMIDRFTENLYELVFREVTRSGNISPLVGHNVVLKWGVMKECAFVDEKGILKFWSENRVSEDFDICIRMQNKGYIGKYMILNDFYFQEGISLTYDDEMKKYSKFAYGASEIMFNPLRKWIKNGVINHHFKRYLKSKIPFATKLSLTGYLMTYFAIASTIIIIPLNMVGECYIDSWNDILIDSIFIQIFSLVVFSLFTPFTTLVLRWKLSKHTNCDVNVLKELKLGMFMFVFYSGIAFTVFTSTSCHLLGIKKKWGATIKELDGNISKKTLLLDICKNNKEQFIFMGVLTVYVLLLFSIGCVNVYNIVSIGCLILGHLIVPFVMYPQLF